MSQFAERLQWMMDLSEDQYLTISRTAARYLMQYDVNDPPELRLQRLVSSLVKNDSPALAKIKAEQK